MALSSISAAFTQFDANANWYGSAAAAALRLEAVEYLIAHRATRSADQGSQLDYDSLLEMRKALLTFLGAGAPRASGRSRFTTASFCGSGGVS